MAKTGEQEAHISGPAPAEDADAGRDEHGLTVLKVSKGDMPAPDPRHAGPEKLGVPKDVFDPNAAYRNKLGYSPGLQDSEAKNPAVWVDQENDDARKASADAHEQDARRDYERAQKRAKAIREGKPLDNEVR